MTLTRRDFLQSALGVSGAVTTAGGLLAPARLAQAAPQPDRKLRIGIIGSGRRGNNHINTTQKNFASDCEIAAICDIRDDRITETRKRIPNPVETYKDYKLLLERAPINTVVIATPTYLHKEMAIAALQKGYDIYCEKPMGINTRECTDVINVWLRSDCVLCNGLQMRYHPLYREVMNMLQDDAIGDLKYIWAIEFRPDWAKKHADPMIDRKVNYMYYEYQSGGTCNNKNCHDFDIFNLLTGSKAKRAAGFGGTAVYEGRESQDHYTSIIEYENGVKATMGLLLFNYGYKDTVLVGDKGKLMFQRSGMEITWTGRYKDEKEEVIALSNDPADLHGSGGNYGIWKDFIEGCKERRPVWAGPFVGREAVRVADAIQTSMKENRMVACSELS